MLRVLLRLLRIKDFEVCPCCEVLKQQLDIANQDKHELTNTLLGLLKPEIRELPPREVTNLRQAQGSVLFSRRRAELERADREKAKTLAGSSFVARPDDIEEIIRPTEEQVTRLERELGISVEG